MAVLQTTLCYLEKSGAYLMLHRNRKKNDVNHEKWIGVGGKFEPGENALACVLREVREETGCIMQNPVYRGILDFSCPPWPDEQIHLYTCNAFTGEPTEFPCAEGELAWVPYDEIFRLPLWQGDEIFLRLLAENAPFFRLGLSYEGDRLCNATLNGEAVALPAAEGRR